MSPKKTGGKRARERELAAQSEKIKLWVESSLFHLLTLLLAWLVYARVVRDTPLPPFFLGAWAMLFFARASLTAASQRYFTSRDSQSLELYSRASRVRAVLSVLILALTAFPLFFYTPFLGKAAAFFQDALRVTSQAAGTLSKTAVVVLSAISGAIGTIVLNILSNLLYDALKTLFKQRTSQEGAPQPEAPAMRHAARTNRKRTRGRR